MTHTEESLMALALSIQEGNGGMSALRLAIREVLAERQQAAMNSISAFAQADENFARAEKAEAECERLRRALQWIVSVNAMDYEYVAIAKKALNGEAECAKQRARAEKAEAEVKRLNAGGCARDQGLAQYCAEAAGLAKDAARYRRLQILGVAPGGSRYLDNGTVLRFTNLDKYVDNDIAAHPSRGESTIEQALRGVCQ